MKRIPSVILLICLLFVTFSCSIKEDRQRCPCVMTLDMSGIDTSVVREVNIQAVSSDGIVFSDTVASSYFSDMYVRDVPHADMVVTVWGTEGTDSRLHIPYGRECPAIYMSAFEADTHGETFCKEVILHKNHCRLTVLFEGREEMPYRLTFRGNVDGYDDTGQPSSGEFACVAYPDVSEGVYAVIPRQRDSSLMLDVEDVDSATLKTFAVGEYLAKSGYDWLAEELGDATVILDYHLTGIKITYKGWDKEYTYDIIL